MTLKHCMFVVWLLGWSIFAGGATVALAQAQGSSQPTTSVPASPLAAYPLDRFSATRERPLFSPSRRLPPPPVVVVAAPPPPPPPPPPLPPPTVTVLGIVTGAEGGRAIVQVAPANEVRRVRTGDDINGWKIVSIDQRQLVLSLDSRSATFTMFGDADNLLKALVNRR